MLEHGDCVTGYVKYAIVKGKAGDMFQSVRWMEYVGIIWKYELRLDLQWGRKPWYHLGWSPGHREEQDRSLQLWKFSIFEMQLGFNVVELIFEIMK